MSVGNFLNDVNSFVFLLGHTLHGFMLVSLGFLLSFITLDPYLSYPLIVLAGYSIFLLRTEDVRIDGEKANIFYYGINDYLHIHNFFIVSMVALICLSILFTVEYSQEKKIRSKNQKEQDPNDSLQIMTEMLEED